jgi:predicted amidohydrolase
VPSDTPRTLVIGLGQISPLPDLAGNRDKIARCIRQAAGRGCRVVAFPEGALHAPEGTPREEIDAAIGVLRREAAAAGIYALIGLLYPHEGAQRLANALLVIDPQGEVLQTYHKLYDVRPNRVPGLFAIDGIPCSAIICADRWIRGVEDLPAVAGARILFECSNNYPAEWIPEQGWYWYVPRALRNGAYVAFVNTSSHVQANGAVHGHGHSALFRPDGSPVVAGDDARDVLLVGEVDVAAATLAEARRRREHPIARAWWDVGLRILAGETVDVPPHPQYRSEEREVGVAVAQIEGGEGSEARVDEMVGRIREAGARGADVVLFPELAVTGASQGAVEAADERVLARALGRLRAAAAEALLYAVWGMPALVGGERRNAAYVVGPEGDVLTRYDQMVVDRPALFRPGRSPLRMWFRMRGVPTAVTIGWREALWSEISELAAVKGAQLRLHLAHAVGGGAEEALRRWQVWVNMASYRTLTAVANAAGAGGGGSAILEDHRRRRGPDYAPHCAVALARAGEDPVLLYARHRVDAVNPHYDRLTRRFNAQMADWYEAGGHAIHAAAPHGSFV